MHAFNEKTLNFEILIKTGKQHRLWAILCLLLCLTLEVFFWFYPPRGYLSENIVLIGSVRGQPLVSFAHFWENRFNNDQLMLEVLEKAGTKKFADKAEALGFLNGSIRRNLKFSPINEIMFNITFVQPTNKTGRPFLNAFTRQFIEEISLLCEEELEKKRQKIAFQFQQLSCRSLFAYNLFEPATMLQQLILNGYEFQSGVPKAIENTFLGKIGALIINEQSLELFNAKISLQNHTDVNQKILSVFPFNTRLLTDLDTPSIPVQPYLGIFYLLVPVSIFLIFLSGLIYLAPDKGYAEKTTDAVD